MAFEKLRQGESLAGLQGFSYQMDVLSKHSAARPGNRLKSLAFEMVCLEAGRSLLQCVKPQSHTETSLQAFGRGLVRRHEDTYGPDHVSRSHATTGAMSVRL